MNRATIDINIKWESLHDGNLKKIGLQPKMDPSKIWTEGYGRALINPKTGDFLKGAENEELANQLATINTEEEAYNDLLLSLKSFSRITEITLGKDYWNKLNDNQKGALVTFVRNCGTINKVTKKPYNIFENIRKFLDKTIDSNYLITYWKSSVTKSAGVELRGLVLRRADEVKLFFTPI